ncbi:hypothetical protein [Shewanella sp.]|uniref:hypothetical protein n=1 Tax=Shewanella sp. TaxID=50422 RepID=UPI0035627D19
MRKPAIALVFCFLAFAAGAGENLRVFIKLSRFASDGKVVELRPTPDQEGIYSNPLLPIY